MGQWSFGRKLGTGFGVSVLLTIAIGWVASYALRSVVEAKDRVLDVHARILIDAQKLDNAAERQVTAVRGFLLTEEPRYREDLHRARSDVEGLLSRIRARTADPEAQRRLEAVGRASTEQERVNDAIMTLRQRDASPEAIERMFVEEVRPRRQALSSAVDAVVALEERQLSAELRGASETAVSATRTVVGIALGATLFAIAIAFFLTRALTRQIGSAVGQVQSSSSELQAAANQQATSSREQASAMSEITTTISELLATSRQIAESAQRVAQMASQTAGSARSGDGTVSKAHQSVATIQRQVELVVEHMLDLGKKSQQIGAVLEIVSELAEQTNILAINATIEANGAGEAGRRFSVVADEIRKLADRVGGSTKEIRMLIEDVRGAVNTTVMATETGSKAVEAGSRQFGEVTDSFKQISDLVSTTTDAAREIELSTKQQTTAVEQVNVAIANVAQATKESEASSQQTLQTASQLAFLSKDLSRLVQPSS